MPERPVRPGSTRSLVLLVAALLLVPGAGYAQASFSDLPAVLGSGDVLRVEVWRQPEFSGEFEVTMGGSIAHPLYRGIGVAGRDLDAVEEDIRAFLQEFVGEPNLVVEGFVRISVGGEVRQPDVYPLRLDTSVARAVALAGGPTDRGAWDRVVVRRGGEELRLDLTDPATHLRELEVRSGDEIVVERRRDIFREFVAPSASVVAAIATVLRLIL
jgi:polysaccharide biosynthesis/export protein VpsN